MGEMKCMWTIPQVKKEVKNVTSDKSMDKKFAQSLFEMCVAAAQRAKAEHTYHNIKGELESSTGVVILQNRRNLKRWKLQASTGSNPALGLRDFRKFIINELVGKSTLYDGTFIPEKSVIGFVVAAAPYAGHVESRGREVLNESMPPFSVIHEQFMEDMGN